MLPHEVFLQIPPAEIVNLRRELITELARDCAFQRKYWERYHSWIEEFSLSEEPDIYADRR